MEFDVFRCRSEGKLIPAHVRWGNKVRGDLYVTELYDPELARTIRIATIKDSKQQSVLEPLLDVVLLAAKPDWWTMTGWERCSTSGVVTPAACQQSWILIPAEVV